MKVWLDDERPAPDGYHHVRTASAGIELLKSGQVTELSLDHDLGPPDAGTGYDVLVWLEQQVAEYDVRPPKLHVHSQNPVGRARMLVAIRAIYNLAKTPPSSNG